MDEDIAQKNCIFATFKSDRKPKAYTAYIGSVTCKNALLGVSVNVSWESMHVDLTIHTN